MKKLLSVLAILLLAGIGVAREPSCGSIRYLGDFFLLEKTTHIPTSCWTYEVKAIDANKYVGHWFTDRAKWMNAFLEYARTHRSTNSSFQPTPTQTTSPTYSCTDLDTTGDGLVTYSDYAKIKFHLGETNCGPENNYCEGTDIDHDGTVTTIDRDIVSPRMGVAC